MKKENKTSKTMDEYIAGFPEEIRQLLESISETINKAAPYAEEVISYAMPTFKLNGNLVHFAAFKNHIGFYPAASGIIAYKDELVKYKSSKSAVQFPLDKKLPLGIIAKIVKYRVKENLSKKKKNKL